MTKRFAAALGVAVLLLSFVFFCQHRLLFVATELAEETDGVCALLSEEDPEGEAALEALLEHFSRHRFFISIFISDTRVHELQRSLYRAQRLNSAGDVSPALEALSDLSQSLREVAVTHVPSWENIL